MAKKTANISNSHRMIGHTFTSCLLTIGAACEKLNGISHLFEHLLISKLLNDYSSVVENGFTTEDYVILFCIGINSKDILKTIIESKFDRGEVLSHQCAIIKEIQRQSIKDEEAFFRFLWQGTDYEKSPLGTVEDILSITPDIIEITRQEILKKPLFFYSTDVGLEIINENAQEMTVKALMKINKQRNKTFHNRCYDIYYFNGRIEAFHLITQILKDTNPKKHIQMSEKKKLSALILEVGTKFPLRYNIGNLRKKAFHRLHQEIVGIKNKINERALNELESTYFYGKRWEERINSLTHVTDIELLSLVRELKLA